MLLHAGLLQKRRVTSHACMQISGETVGDIRVVPDMHTRKAMMSAEADAFIGIPGGFGTLEEVRAALALRACAAFPREQAAD